MNYSKLFGCNIHDTIRVSPMALKIINTPEFQRMRCIKQLGLCSYVYPSATHTRFEHSIGVYHLAGKMLEKIQIQYPYKVYEIPELGGKILLTEKIIECIKIAALCHDIGHGPFSHIFDDILLADSTHPNKYHEVRSCLIVQLLCERELSSELTSGHIEFIKSIIDPQKQHTGALYQIVSNNLNGIDVDKFDYLARDSKNLGISGGFDYMRLINELIIDTNNNIAYPKHCTNDIYEMFHSRYMMHKKVYSHKTVKLLESMLSDIFVIVDPIFKISSAIENMDKFCKLTDDSIFQYIKMIIHPPLPFCEIKLEENELISVQTAYKIYERIVSRNLYKQIISIDYNAKDIIEKFLMTMIEKYPYMSRNDFEIVNVKIGFVSGNKPDPFCNIYFYNKKENNHTFTLEKNNISGLLNNNIQEQHTHLFCKNRDIYKTAAHEFKSTFYQFFNENITTNL